MVYNHIPEKFRASLRKYEEKQRGLRAESSGLRAVRAKDELVDEYRRDAFDATMGDNAHYVGINFIGSDHSIEMNLTINERLSPRAIATFNREEITRLHAVLGAALKNNK